MPLRPTRMRYDDEVDSLWRPAVLGPRGPVRPTPDQLRELVRHATLAPSSHNTQCWRFVVAECSISILPDWSRRCPRVDPDDHHLFVSLGCALQNLVEAAAAAGFVAEPTPACLPDAVVTMALSPSRAVASPSFMAITARQCTRADYDGRPLGNDELRQLQAAGTGQGVGVVLLTGRGTMEQVLELVVAGNTMQLRDPLFTSELKSWVRFNDAEALRSGDGLSARCMGNPSLPSWLGRALFGALVRPRHENDKVARQIRSSSGIAVFFSDGDDRAHWIEAGRCYQRFALLATSLGIRNAFVNQAVEVASVRSVLAQAVGLRGSRPDLLVRFGRGPLMPRSLRRPLEAVVV
ncbi:MAG TPA: nitroreductase family protein [Lysobacter sp.]|nr:nitroreductase family protein [Lysobacter sp.]